MILTPQLLKLKFLFYAGFLLVSCQYKATQALQNTQIEEIKFLGRKHFALKAYEQSVATYLPYLGALDNEDKRNTINALFLLGKEAQALVVFEQQILDKMEYINDTLMNGFDEKEKIEKRYKKEIARHNEKTIKGFKMPTLAQELIQLEEADQGIRLKFMQALEKSNGVFDKEFMACNALMGKIDSANLAFVRIHFLMDDKALPSQKEIGKIGLQTIFYVVQHSLKNEDRIILLKKLQQQPMSEHVLTNTFFLEDRINVGTGKKQRYGTQYQRMTSGNVNTDLEPIESIEFADKWRTKVGMLTIAHQKELIRLGYY
ncbi:MAG: hypothetical protein RLZZ292_328 [Bacteroidota bacterium]|jgi:hypothetical protein